MKQLFLNGFEIELDVDDTCQLTKQKTDIGDFTQKSNYSNTITIPHTPVNDSFFYNKKYEKLDCRYVVNSIEVISNGLAYIDGQDDKGYKCMLIGGLKDFTKLIDVKTLNDLDLTSMNHTWDYLNEITPPADIKYLLTENDSVTVSNTIDVNLKKVNALETFPCISAKRLLQEITEQAGFKCEFSDLDTNPIMRTYLQMPNTKLLTPEEVRGVWGTEIPFVKEAPFPRTNINQNILIYENPTSCVFLENGAGYYKTRYDGSYRIELLMQVLNPRGYTVMITVENGANVYLGEDTVININYSTDIVRTAGIYLTPKIAVFGIQTVLSFNPNVTVTSFALGISVTPGTSISFVCGDTFRVAMGLPNMKQVDFLKQICQQSFLIPNIEKNKITYTPYRSIFTKSEKAQDWSDYLVDIKSTVYKIGDWAQKNTFVYDFDKGSEFYNGEGVITIDNAILADKKERVKLSFSASREVSAMGGLPFAYTPFMEYGVWKGGLKPKLLTPLAIDGTVEYLGAGATVLGTSTTAEAGVFDIDEASIAFPAILQTEANELTKALSKAEVITVAILLPATAFYALSDDTPIFLKQTSSYYFCNKINGWELDKQCTAELIKL